MRICVVLGAIGICAVASAANAQTGGATCTISGSISGTLSSGSYQSDTYSASVSATFTNASGQPTTGYVGGYPKLKYKFYLANGTQLGDPGLYDPDPNSFGVGGYGSASTSKNGTNPSSWLSLTHDLANNGAQSVLRQWKMYGIAGTSNGQAQDELNILASSSDSISLN